MALSEDMKLIRDRLWQMNAGELAKEAWSAVWDFAKWALDWAQSAVKGAAKATIGLADTAVDLWEWAVDVITWWASWVVNSLLWTDLKGTHLLTGDSLLDNFTKEVTEKIDSIDLVDSAADDSEFWQSVMNATEVAGSFIGFGGPVYKVFQRLGKARQLANVHKMQKNLYKVNQELLKLKKTIRSWVPTPAQYSKLKILEQKAASYTTEIKGMVKEGQALLKGSVNNVKNIKIAPTEKILTVKWMKKGFAELSKKLKTTPSNLVTKLKSMSKKKALAWLVWLWITASVAQNLYEQNVEGITPEWTDTTDNKETKTDVVTEETGSIDTEEWTNDKKQKDQGSTARVQDVKLDWSLDDLPIFITNKGDVYSVTKDWDKVPLAKGVSGAEEANSDEYQQNNYEVFFSKASWFKG